VWRSSLEELTKARYEKVRVTSVGCHGKLPTKGWRYLGHELSLHPSNHNCRDGSCKTDLSRPVVPACLQQKNVSTSTVRQYLRACNRRMTYLHHTDSSTQIAWIEWTAPDGEKRLTGFAVRKYEQFADEVLGDVSTFGVPRKSRPDPHPIQRRDIRKMRLASV